MNSKFQCLAKAINSLEIFPEILKNFTAFLTQKYLSEENPSKVEDLEWIVILRDKYYDNCHSYVTFIENRIATQFLAECLTKEALERTEIITELKANIEAAEGRLVNFTSNMSKDDVLKTIVEAEKQPKQKEHFQHFTAWLKGQVLDAVSPVFATIIGPLWHMIKENVELAVQSDYDYQTLVQAVKMIRKNLEVMDGSIKGNR